MSNLFSPENLVNKCIVCKEKFNIPISLNCGHLLCQLCVFTRMNEQNVSKKTIDPQTENERFVVCPHCENVSILPDDGFPVASSDVYVPKAASVEKTRACSTIACQKLCIKEDLCMCKTCDEKLLCLSCTIGFHNGHHLFRWTDVMEEYKNKVIGWKFEQMFAMNDKKSHLEEMARQIIGYWTRVKNFLDGQMTEVDKQIQSLQEGATALANEECDWDDGPFDSAKIEFQSLVERQNEIVKTRNELLVNLRDFVNNKIGPVSDEENVVPRASPTEVAPDPGYGSSRSASATPDGTTYQATSPFVQTTQFGMGLAAGQVAGYTAEQIADEIYMEPSSMEPLQIVSTGRGRSRRPSRGHASQYRNNWDTRALH